MTVLTELAAAIDRKDERPNIKLARELVDGNDVEGIQEVIESLGHNDRKVKNDSMIVAYGIGRLKPELISDYAQIFIDLLKDPNHRMASGAMRVLSTLALVSSQTLLKNLPAISLAIKKGSSITVDKGILTLVKLAGISEEANKTVFPYLLMHLKTCPTKELPRHAESIMLVVTEKNKVQFLEVISEREHCMIKPQARRLKRLLCTWHKNNSEN